MHWLQHTRVNTLERLLCNGRLIICLAVCFIYICTKLIWKTFIKFAEPSLLLIGVWSFCLKACHHHLSTPGPYTNLWKPFHPAIILIMINPEEMGPFLLLFLSPSLSLAHSFSLDLWPCCEADNIHMAALVNLRNDRRKVCVISQSIIFFSLTSPCTLSVESWKCLIMNNESYAVLKR